jgi:hypothetical protein
MALHNWVFGHVFVPLSANATVPTIYVMPPSVWLGALGELMTLHWNNGDLARALHQIPAWLSGPAESFATVPINAGGVAILAYVVLRGRRFDPWLRLIGAAALVQHAVALVYVASARYHFLTWFLTGLIAAVWLRQAGIPWLARRYPVFCRRVAESSARLRLASALSRLQKVSS